MSGNRPLEQQVLWTNGKISANSLGLIKSGLPQNKSANSEILFIGYTFDDIPVGKSFAVIFPKNKPTDGINCESKIVAVTQQFGKPFDGIPNGWKTICIVEFPRGIPDLIKNLPIVESWFENEEYICFCDNDVWEAIKQSKL